jgi:preprotein translocase subunit YajC
MQFDFFTVGLVALLAVMVIFMFRSSRRRRAAAADLETKIQPGVQVITQHGIYGKLLSLDDDTNEALVETTPGTVLRLHRQVIARVIEPTEPEAKANNRDLREREESGSAAGRDTAPSVEPKFGERVEKPKTPRERKKPPA